MVSTTRRVLSVLLVLCLLGVPAAFAQAPSVVHPFDGVAAGNPAAGLTLGADGFLYGTTEAPASQGAVFRVRPDGTNFQVLHVFARPAGVMPGHGALARGLGGVFYGTTLQGGAADRGTVYRLETGPFGATVTTLHEFAAVDANPDGGVILASDGLLYGTFGDDQVSATVYRLATDGTAFEYLRILPNGYRPTGTLLEGSDGLLYGTTERGGVNDGGTVFRLNRDGTAFVTLVELEGNPVSGLTEAPGPDGTPHLFGVETTGQNAVTEFGAIFQLRRDGAAFLRLSAFTASNADGSTPRSPLLLGRDGSLYGTTTSENIACPPENCGTVFRITPAGRPFSLFTFPRVVGGAPMGALVQGPDGTLYGTARVGGPDATAPGTGHGVVFAVPTPDRVPLELTGPPIRDEGDEAVYTLTLRNTTNHTLAGPITVAVTLSPGLVLTDQSADGWSCTQPQALGLLCVWPTDLPPGVDSDAHTLHFAIAPPFSLNCGTGPSPCVSLLATVSDLGAAASTLTAVRALVGGTFNTPPVPQDDTVPIYGTATATIRVLDNDVDPDGDALRVTRLLQFPRFGDATINADGTITYTPADTLLQPDTFRYEVSDDRVPGAATASALVTLTPSIPSLTASKTRLDLGPLAPRRIATGRFSLRSPVAMEVRIELQPVTAAEIAAALQGTAYDPAQAVSDPDAFRSDGRLSIDPLYSAASVVGVHYQAPPSVGRVSVARVQIIGEAPGAAPVTRSLLIVASSADPATAPPRAVDDTTATPVQTSLWYDVLANDGGVSVDGRPLYVSSVGCMHAFPDTDCFVPVSMAATQTLPASITGPQDLGFATTTAVTGTATGMYAVSELDACVIAPQPGDCQLEGNMYYGYLSVEVGGTPPDLALTIAPATQTVAPGDLVTLTATVTNQGPGMASRVTISGFTDLTRLTGLVFTPSQGRCVVSAPGQPLTCTLGSLVQGASAAITLQGTAEASLIPAGQSSATLDVTAAVSFGNADSQPGNNIGQAQITVTRPDPLPTIDFGTLSASPEGTAPGPAGTITVNLQRQGDLSRESTVTYSLSAGPAPSASPDDIVGGFASGSITFAVNQVFAGITIFTTPDSLDEPDENVLLTLTGATGATLTMASQVISIIDDDLPQRSADVRVTLTATPQVVDEMQPVEIRATVYNAFVGGATNVTFSGLDAIVNTHIIDSVTPSQGTCEPVVQGSPVRCSLGSMAVWGTATVTVVARPTSSVFQGTVQPTANVTMNAVVSADESDPVPSNNSATGMFQVRRVTSDLTIAKTTASTFQQGGRATYDLVVSNVGTWPTSGSYTIGDVMPTGLTISGLTPGAGWDCSASTATVVSCTRSTVLPVGQSAPLVTVNVAITATAPASITNTATVAGGGETNTGNNTASVTSAVSEGAPDLTVSMTTTSTFQRGGTATYELVVSNVGTGPIADSRYSVLIRTPTDLAASAEQSNWWSCSANETIEGTWTTCVGVRDLPAGQSAAALIVNVAIAATAPASITSTAAVFGDYDTNTGNNTSSVTSTVVAQRPPSADAGPDQVLEALNAAGAPATLAGTGIDPDGGAVTFAWSGACGVGAGPSVTVQCPRGVSVVTLTTTNPGGLQGTDTLQITVLDRVAPAIAITAPADGATYALNQVVNASYSCTDAVGVATCQGSVPTGTALDTSTVGPQTFTVTATDAAGNQSQVVRQYSVVLPTVTTCRGEPNRQILAPINADGSSRFLAGLPVLARFRVCGPGGQSLGTPGLVTSFRLVQSTTAAGVVVATDAPVPTLFGPSAIVWNSLTQSWLTLIDTRRLARRATHAFRITLNDGSTIDFTFFVR